MSKQEHQEQIPIEKQLALKYRLQQMKQTSNEWADKQFSQDNAKCQFKNPAIIVCTNPQCTYAHPFICRLDGCKCISSHFQCSTQQVEFISSQIKLQTNPTAKLRQEAERVIDRFISELIYCKNQFRQGFDLGLGNRSFERLINNQQSTLQPLLAEEPTGKLISELLKLKNESKTQTKIEQKIQTLSKSGQTFIQKRIKPLIMHFQNILFHENSTRWGPSHLSLIERQEEDQSQTTSLNTQNQYCLKLISPGIIYVTGKIVKCRLRVKSLTSEMAFGIGLNQKIQNSLFKLDKLQKFGCFITNSGQIHIYKGGGQSKKILTGITIRRKDIIMIEVDTKDWKLKFRNEKTDLSFEVKIPFIPEIENDQYHFCVGFKTLTDQVDLLEDLEDNFANGNETTADSNGRMRLN